jgi:hypothetical protein
LRGVDKQSRRTNPETFRGTIAPRPVIAPDGARDRFGQWLLHKAVSGKLLCARGDGRLSGWL